MRSINESFRDRLTFAADVTGSGRTSTVVRTRDLRRLLNAASADPALVEWQELERRVCRLEQRADAEDARRSGECEEGMSATTTTLVLGGILFAFLVLGAIIAVAT